MSLSRRTLIPTAIAAAIAPKITGAEEPDTSSSYSLDRYNIMPGEWRVSSILYGRDQIQSLIQYVNNVVIIDKEINKIVDTRTVSALELFLNSDDYIYYDTRNVTLDFNYTIVNPEPFSSRLNDEETLVGFDVEVTLLDGRVIRDTITEVIQTEAHKHVIVPWIVTN
jgi:hypothetical protein